MKCCVCGKEVDKNEVDQRFVLRLGSTIVNIFTSSSKDPVLLTPGKKPKPKHKDVCKKCAMDAIKGAIMESLNKGEDRIKK